jgi:Contact-dependent growth inhibition CdiA C-terminal domain
MDFFLRNSRDSTITFYIWLNLKSNAMKIPFNRFRFEAYESVEWQQIYFDVKTEGYVVLNHKHGKYESKANLQTALRLAKQGKTVELLPAYGIVMSADAFIDDEIWELKTTNGSRSSIQNRLRKGKKQARNTLLEIQNEDFDWDDIILGIISIVNTDKDNSLQKIALLLPNSAFLEFSREDILKRRFEKITPYL